MAITRIFKPRISTSAPTTDCTLPCMFSSSSSVTVGRKGCTIPGGLVSRKNLTVFRMRLRTIVWRPSHITSILVGCSIGVTLNRQNRLVQHVVTCFAWPFNHSSRLVIFYLVIYYVDDSDRSWGFVLRYLDSRPNNLVISLDFSLLTFLTWGGQLPNPEEK